MADLQFTVDTSPMASSINEAKGHLNGVTLAVTTMETAVIAAERETSKTICKNVDEGFYMLIKSQISQKAVAAYTEMTSKQITMVQLLKALDNVKRQMESDYNMITRRYAKLFQSLNKELEIRIKELDQPAMRLAEIRECMVFDKLKNDSSLLFSVSGEAVPLVQTALSGKLKQKTREAIHTLSENVYENTTYSEKVNDILIRNDDNFPLEENVHFLPTVFFITDSLLNSGGYIENVYTVQTDIWQNTAPIILEINRIHKNLNWTPTSSGDKDLIRGEFIAICEKESNEERVSKEIIRLFDESVWEDCKK